MSSLTTLFIVGPEEYVEFNESMGSKVFLEHVWDQGKTPLKEEDTSASGTYLHSAGARVSQDPPPRIEFPTVLRVKGKGNKYKQTGKWISWEALKSKHPLALLDPPNLEEFLRRGATVGDGEKIGTGAWLKENKVSKGTPKPDSNWVGGSSQSIYAAPSPQLDTDGHVRAAIDTKNKEDTSSQLSLLDQNGWLDASDSQARPPKTRLSVKLGGNKLKSTQGELQGEISRPQKIRKSRSGLSLSERLGMDEIKEASKEEQMPSFQEAVSPVEDRKEGSRRSRPSKLDLHDLSSSHTLPQMNSVGPQIPLSASHPPPETPLKHAGRHQREGSDLPTTPGSELALHNANASVGAVRKGGLLLDPGEGDPVLPKELQTPGKEKFLTSLTESSGTPGPSLPAKLQIDHMLSKLKLARPSSGGIQESRWAVKAVEESSADADKAGNAPNSRSSREKARGMTDDISEKKPILDNTSKPEHLSTPAPTSSLLSRMSAAPETVRDASKPAKGKKERKRGSRKTDTSLDDAAEPVALLSDKKGADDIPVQPPSSNHSMSVVDVVVDSKKASPCEAVSAQDRNIPHSTSAASVATATSMESSSQVSNTANETMTSINWADEDDDLPDLPEEWTRLSSAATAPEYDASSSTQSVPPSPALVGGSSFDSANAISKRGTKRGGKGRTKKERNEHQPELPSAPKAMQIAGSAARAANQSPSTAPTARKELFPSHAADTSAPSRATATKEMNGDLQRNGRRETRPHGRPKLATSGKDAFDRLAKGAVSMSSRDVPASNGSDRHRRPPGQQGPSTQAPR